MSNPPTDHESAVLSWSGGKDASLALYELQVASVPVVELLTTVNMATDRSSMHGVRTALHRRQAAALGLSVRILELPPEPTNETYARTMRRAMDRYARDGIETVAFADIALTDVRAYRERRLRETPVVPRFPLWGRDTMDIARSFINAGFEATVVAVNGDELDASFAGRSYDPAFLADLPAGVDPAGEHGEFHTFVTDGPPFDEPVEIAVGERVSRTLGDTTMHYVDLRPTGPR